MDLERTKKLIRLHEGLRLFPYDDHTGNRIQGKVTIGYGRNLNDRGIDKNEAESMLQTDLEYLIIQLPKRIHFFAQLDDVRQAVLFDIGYNIGVNGLLGFDNMLSDMMVFDFDDASDELLDSKLCKEEPEREANLIQMLKTGRWPDSIT